MQYKLQNFEWERIGDVLKVQGTLLDEGLWTGLDNIPTQFPLEVIHRGLTSFIGKPIKHGHTDGEPSVGGFITAVKRTVTGGKFEGVVFNKEMIDEMELNMVSGWSIEADVSAEKDGERAIAQTIAGSAVASVKSPACKTCRTDVIQPIKLEEKKMTIELEKPSRADFFNWLAEALKKAGLEDAQVSKVTSILKGAIKSPYPYPAPAAEKKEEKEELFANPIFQREFRGQLAKAEIPEEKIVAIMGLVKAATGKYSLSEKPEEKLVGELEGQDAVIQKLKTDLAEEKKKTKELKGKVEAFEKTMKEAKLAALKEVVLEIKKLDDKFDETKFLEGIEDLAIQSKMLTTYFETMKRLKPDETKLSVADPNSIQLKVKKFLGEMGVDNIKDIIEGA